MSIGGVGGGAPMMRSFKPPTFESLDSNSSGDITLDELKAAAPGGADNAKSSARAEKLFAAMDADGSGSVSSDEKDAFDEKMKAARDAMQFMTQLMGSNGGGKPPSNDDIFANTDKDGSGGISLDEFSQGDAAKSLSTDQLSQLFSTIDSDGDGSITSTESSDFLDTLKSAVGGHHGGPPPGGGPGGPGGPPPGGPPPSDSASSDSSDDEDTSAINLLSAATSAYASKQKSADLLSKLSSIFDQAA